MLSHQMDLWTPSTDEDRTAVLQQLDRLLQNPHFHKSKRFPVFLKFVVNETLAGRAENLKERTLGIEVFGRDPDYDTTEDPIVRVTAGEIRKRIAQYYQDPGHEHELRLMLPSGSYAPQFFPAELSGPAIDQQPDHLEVADSPARTSAVPHQRAIPISKLIIAFAVLAVVAGGIALWRYLSPSAIDQFWAPFVKSPDPVLFCIADQNQYSTMALRDAADPARQTTLNDHMVTVIIDDVGPLVNIAGLLQTYGRSYRVEGEAVTTLTDLRRSPTIFIGAFDNSWTLRLTSPLRFHFANNPEMTSFWIEDRNAPNKKTWVLDRTRQDTGTYKDYAIVARLVDSNTDRYAVVAAGIARGGTVAAGEFLVDNRRLEELAHWTSQDWSHKNLEIILETQVIGGRSGPPRIVAVHAW
ncbi:MAG TPA: hypothetical protein VG897_19350 [Terriglobales bacterium]|nr:hypothetical protein [Terriglobales bacterium]